MPVALLTAEELAGVREKLKRAYENIRYLNAEIETFLNTRPADLVFSDDKLKAVHQLFKYHTERRVLPPRFSVIAGEIIHHLRSCLDHIAWSLSSQQYRIDHETAIAFPVVTKIKPWTEKEIKSYERKIKGIASPEALVLIERLQPCHAREPSDNPLAVIHQLDRIDKHHNLVLVVTSFDLSISVPFPQSIVLGGIERSEKLLSSVVQDNPEITIALTVAFGEFGKRKNQSIIPSLMNLADSIADVIKLFAGEI